MRFFTIKGAFAVLLVLALVSCSSTPKKQPWYPSPLENPTGFLKMTPVDTFYIGLPAYVKRFDAESEKWVEIGEAGDVMRLPATKHRIGLVYSTAPGIIAIPKLLVAVPDEAHIVTIDVAKDTITVVPFTIESKLGGFGWTMKIHDQLVELPSRHRENAMEALHTSLAQLATDEPDHLGLATLLVDEITAVADPRSIDALAKMAERDPRHEYLSISAIKKIERMNKE